MGTSTALKRRLFPHGFAGEVMDLIYQVWKGFSKPDCVIRENRITALLRDAILEYSDEDRISFIALEDPITDSLSGTETGRNDLRFYPKVHYKQTLFFTVECKKLHIRTTSSSKHNCDAYVKDGMIRFISNDSENTLYAEGLPCGGMVGYVLDNKVQAAFNRVNLEINNRSAAISLVTNGISSPSSAIPKYKYSLDTTHNRKDGEFKLHHMLLGVRTKTTT